MATRRPVAKKAAKTSAKSKEGLSFGRLSNKESRIVDDLLRRLRENQESAHTELVTGISGPRSRAGMRSLVLGLLSDRLFIHATLADETGRAQSYKQEADGLRTLLADVQRENRSTSRKAEASIASLQSEKDCLGKLLEAHTEDGTKLREELAESKRKIRALEDMLSFTFEYVPKKVFAGMLRRVSLYNREELLEQSPEVIDMLVVSATVEEIDKNRQFT